MRGGYDAKVERIKHSTSCGRHYSHIRIKCITFGTLAILTTSIFAMCRAIPLLLLLVVAMVCVSAQPASESVQSCGPNEEFKSCGSACVDTCERQAAPICTMDCVIGCQCKPGFVRNKSNQCVLTRDC